MTEIWKDIKDYEGLYAVSNQGRVKSLNYKRTGKERILKPARDTDGYLRITLYKDGVKKQFLVHRLVAEAFLPKVEGKEFIDHIVPVSEGGTNEVSNLRWCTYKENNNNPLSKEKQKGEKAPWYGKFGAEHPKSKPIIGVSKETGEEVWFTCTYEAERVLNINHRNITACCLSKRKSAGEYYWNYQEEEEKKIS